MQLTTINREEGGCFRHELPLANLSFIFTAEKPFSLPIFNASMWRGAFGHALRRTVCVTGQKHCEGCCLRESCAYAYLFETPPPAHADRMRRYDAVPHPFVIRNQPVSRSSSRRTRLAVDILLMGRRMHELFPYVLHAMQRAGMQGLSRDRVRLTLEQVTQMLDDEEHILWQEGALALEQPTGTVPDVPPCPDGPVTIDFLTPMRLVLKGQTIGPQAFRPVHLWRSLTRRLSMLEYFHAGHSLDADFPALHRRAEELTWESPRFREVTWNRYSSRQRRRIPLAGLVGRSELNLKGHESLWPWLWLGQHLHAGKATVMGLGQYRIGTDDKLVKSALSLVAE